ncbi:MAG: VanW family protein, partial [Fimbriimonadaceae bacterium]
MRKGIIATLVVCASTSLGLVVAATRHEEVAAPGAKVGPIVIAGLSKEAAAKKIRTWWEMEKMRDIKLSLPESTKFIAARPGQLGFTVDDQATLQPIPFRGFWDEAKALIDKGDENKFVPIKFKKVGEPSVDLVGFVEENVDPPKAARIFYEGGKFTRISEIPGMELDEDQVAATVLKALTGNGEETLALRTSKPKISPEQLEAINEIRTEFTTRFSEGNVSRSSNIRTAAGKINGLVLAPGDRFSFNGTVGRRSAASGFKEAGVYKDGRHDIDFGGGICQVSTTLYNAALFSDLKIAKRSNHSMPVPYVPLGRDATVDWNGIDLVIENNLETPIALSSSVAGGRITFRILGKKDPSLKVEMISSGSRSWDAGQQTIKDPSLPAGVTKVIERGTAGRAVSTWRVVYRDGKEVRRDTIGESYYRGGKRIVAVGTAAPRAPAPKATPDLDSTP